MFKMQCPFSPHPSPIGDTLSTLRGSVRRGSDSPPGLSFTTAPCASLPSKGKAIFRAAGAACLRCRYLHREPTPSGATCTNHRKKQGDGCEPPRVRYLRFLLPKLLKRLGVEHVHVNVAVDPVYPAEPLLPEEISASVLRFVRIVCKPYAVLFYLFGP